MFTKELSASKPVQPSFFEPMYAEAVRVLPDGGLWTYEAKLDGYRCLAAKRSGRITLCHGAEMALHIDSRRSLRLARNFLTIR